MRALHAGELNRSYWPLLGPWHDDSMTTEELTPEQKAAAAEYNRLQRSYEKTHLDWHNGDATIEEDRAADEARKAALREVRRLADERGH